jgi:hypothetical protein
MRKVFITKSWLALLSLGVVASAPVPSPLPKDSPPPSPLDVNDISFLWPVPQNKADVDALISLDEQAADGKKSSPRNSWVS